MPFDARVSIDRGLHHLSQRLEPVIAAKLAPHLGSLAWPTILSELDRMRGRTPKAYAATDLQSQLRVITERLGALGYPFDDRDRYVTTLGSELRIARNRWAHHDELSTLDAWRTHDFAVRLLGQLGDTDGAAHAALLREEAFDSLAEEKSAATHVEQAPAEAEEPVDPTTATEEVVTPDPAALTRIRPIGTPTIGDGRYQFEAWTVVPVGDVSVLDSLPKKVAKEQVRAVASEIAEFEGPIHIDRLAQLTAASFGVRRLWPKRAKKLIYQITQAGLVLDEDKFVWPSDLSRASWQEFRPNDSTVERPFLEISPVEVANAMRVLLEANPDLDDADLDAATLRAFGRKRRTRRFAAHLARARRLL